MATLQVHFSSATVEWSTPKELYESLHKEFQFDLDPCPLGGTQDALAPLSVKWDGRRVFCNPPYGPLVNRFLERGSEADVAVFLLPARTDTRWFHDIVLPKAQEIRFIRGRLAFERKDSKRSRAPFPSMIVVFRQ